MRVIFPLLLALLVAGCGFHLQGQGQLPAALQQVSLTYAQDYTALQPPLLHALRNELERRGGVVGAGGNTLTISNLTTSNDILSVDINGKAVEYLLTEEATYQLKSGAGKVLAGPDSLRVSRDYSFQSNQVLGSEAEQRQLKQQMEEQLASLIVLRLIAQTQ